MIMRLYILIQSLLYTNMVDVPLNSSATATATSSSTSSLDFGRYRDGEKSDDDEEQDDDDGGQGERPLGWTAWAMSWLPPISSFLGDEFEDGEAAEVVDPCSKSSSSLIEDSAAYNSAAHPRSRSRSRPPQRPRIPLLHYGIYVNKLYVTFKALERIHNSKGQGQQGQGPQKVRFLPYMKLSLQGVAMDAVFRGEEANHQIGISWVRSFNLI